jgi:hypothetical protein
MQKMLESPVPDPHEESDRLDVAADEAIAACGGNMRSAIRALILANDYLEFELDNCQAAVSRGFSRGKHAKSDDESE